MRNSKFKWKICTCVFINVSFPVRSQHGREEYDTVVNFLWHLPSKAPHWDHFVVPLSVTLCFCWRHMGFAEHWL